MNTSILPKVILAGIFILSLSFNIKLFAQDPEIEITPFGGYLLGGSIKFYQGKFKIENNACYGGMMAFQFKTGQFIELSYTGMTSQGQWRPYSNYAGDYPRDTIDLSVNYLLLGTVNEILLQNEAVRPYGTVAIGAAWLNPKNSSAEEEWLFSFAAGLGLKYYFNKVIGVRLQARFLLPMVFSGAGFYFGSGGGGVSVSSTVPIVQGDFTGGLIIALGDF